MADQKVKITQLPISSDIDGGVLLANNGGIDYQTPVNQFLLKKNNLAEVDAQTARSNLNVYSREETLSLSGGNVPAFGSEAEGIAGTTDGQYFMVPSDDDGVKYYKNNSGVAELVGTVIGPSAVTGTIREFPTLEAAQADADAGNIMVGSTAYYRSPDDSALAVEVINNNGTLEPTGLKIPSERYVDESIAPYSPLLNITQASEFFSS
ncbi:TPA: hypothetical protein ACM7BK_000584, partial [Escherichia coli]